MTATELTEQADELELMDEPDEPVGLPRRLARGVQRVATATVRPRERLPAAASATVWALTAFGLLAVWVLLYAFVLSGIQEHRAQSVLYAELRQKLAEATAPLGGAIASGSPVFLMNAPTGGVHGMVVVEGTSASDLTAGAGHLPTTPLPGQAGVSVVLGRSVTFGAPFRNISLMHAGDAITLTTGQGEFGYRVDHVRQAGDPLPPSLAAGQSRIVLVSSVGAGWRAGWAPQQTVYVDASLQTGTVQPAPPGRPLTLSAASQPMKPDTSGLVVLVLWLSALLVIAVTAVWTRARWGTWQTWLSAVPLLVACLWGATQAAGWLVPNLV